MMKVDVKAISREKARKEDVYFENGSFVFQIYEGENISKAYVEPQSLRIFDYTEDDIQRGVRRISITFAADLFLQRLIITAMDSGVFTPQFLDTYIRCDTMECFIKIPAMEPEDFFEDDYVVPVSIPLRPKLPKASVSLCSKESACPRPKPSASLK